MIKIQKPQKLIALMMATIMIPFVSSAGPIYDAAIAAQREGQQKYQESGYAYSAGNYASANTIAKAGRSRIYDSDRLFEQAELEEQIPIGGNFEANTSILNGLYAIINATGGESGGGGGGVGGGDPSPTVGTCSYTEQLSAVYWDQGYMTEAVLSPSDCDAICLNSPYGQGHRTGCYYQPL